MTNGAAATFNFQLSIFNLIVFTFPRLEAAAVVAGRLAEVLGAVAAEVAQGGEVHAVGNLGEREALVVEVFLQDGHGGAVDEAADAVPRHALDGGGEVLGRDVEALGIVAHVALGAADACREHIRQLTDDVGGAVAVGVGGLAPCMELEDVVYHCQAEAPHHFAVEEQVAVVKSVSQAVEVLQHDGRLAVVDFDDGVPVETDAAPDAVVVGWQQPTKKLVVGGKPLYLHARSSGEVLRPVGMRHHHQVVLHNVVAPLVEHKTPLPCRAQQMHACVRQLRSIHAEEIRRVLKIDLHQYFSSNQRDRNTSFKLYIDLPSAKSSSTMFFSISDDMVRITEEGLPRRYLWRNWLEAI